MLAREVYPEEKEKFNTVVNHPLQTWEWGEFRQATGKKTVRLGVFDGEKLISGYQMTVHPIPSVPYNVVYFPKGPAPDKLMLGALGKIGVKEKAIMVKMEPNVSHFYGSNENHEDIKKILEEAGCIPGKPLFTKFTFQIDLTRNEEELLAQMKPKTRYNLRLSQKHGVVVKEDNSDKAFEEFLRLMAETTTRQKFYAHDESYLRKMWQYLAPSGIAHLFTAKYQGLTLTTWILFLYKDTLYYPYGASTREHREVMASNSMMWEAIRFGKQNSCTNFDLWGTPGPNPDTNDPWIGFHRFKEGFGAQLFESIGTWDLVINQPFYKLYNSADNLRWKLLRLRKSLPF